MPITDQNSERQTCDILVVGSGAAGLSAALTAAMEGLDVRLIEKTALLGGTTAYSGGVAWVPGNPAAHGSDLSDDRAAAAVYMDRLIGKLDDGRRQAYLDTIGEAIARLSRHPSVQFVPVADYPDYHPEVEGAGIGRAIVPAPFDGRALAISRFEQIRPPRRDTMLFGKLMLDRTDLGHLLRPWASLHSFGRTALLLARYLRDRMSRSRGAQLRSGNALVARLVHALDDLGVPMAVETRLLQLVRSGGRISAAIVSEGDARRQIDCRLGIILAAGGGASDAALRDSLAGPGEIPIAVSSEGNIGDSFVVAALVGAGLNREMRSPFFMFPGSRYTVHGKAAVWPHLTFADRAKPGVIAVDERGNRFINEASSYQVFSDAMLQIRRARPEARFYLVCDRAFVYKYGFGVVRPFAIGLRRHLRSGYLTAARSAEHLAVRLGIDSAGLGRTLAAYNRDARDGLDPVFGKGSNIYNQFNGDPANVPNPCVAPIATDRLLALELHPAAFGSAVGLSTDKDARVLGDDGVPIPGLYAAGNDMASIMAGTYPGPGITIGPAIAFAYRAVRHAAASRAALPRGGGA